MAAEGCVTDARGFSQILQADYRPSHATVIVDRFFAAISNRLHDGSLSEGEPAGAGVRQPLYPIGQCVPPRGDWCEFLEGPLAECAIVHDLIFGIGQLVCQFGIGPRRHAGGVPLRHNRSCFSITQPKSENLACSPQGPVMTALPADRGANLTEVSFTSPNDFRVGERWMHCIRN